MADIITLSLTQMHIQCTTYYSYSKPVMDASPEESELQRRGNGGAKGERRTDGEGDDTHVSSSTSRSSGIS